MTASTSKRLTIEEFVAQYPENERLELVRGEVVPMWLCGGVHGGVKARVGRLLYEWADDS